MPATPAVSAALALTLLFVADDPRAPVVAVEVVEHEDGRRADLVVVPGAAVDAPGAARPPAFTAHLASPPVDGTTRLRQLPIAPDGAALADVVDGVLVTFDAVGAWVPPAAADSVVAPPAKKGRTPSSPPPPTGPSPSLAEPPSLPIGSPGALRLFVPNVVPGRAVPASLHGVDAGGVPRTFAGKAVVVQVTRSTLALSVAEVVEGRSTRRAFDDSVPVLTGALPTSCASGRAQAVRALQRTTHLELDAVACSGPVVVATGHGVRLGDSPGRDAPARGIVVVRR
jgi:hypothetical protein